MSGHKNNMTTLSIKLIKGKSVYLPIKSNKNIIIIPPKK